MRLKRFIFLLNAFVCCFFFFKNALAVTFLTNCGTLSTANETYVLQNDVTSEGTCFL